MKKIKQKKTRKVSDALGLAVTFQRRGCWPEAENIYRAILKEDPDNAVVYGNLAFVLRSRGRMDEAIDCYNRSLALNPRQADVYNDLGTALQARGRMDEAIMSYSKTLEIAPDHPTALYNLGSACQLKGDIDGAISYYRKAADKSQNAMLFNNLATALTQKGQTGEAITYYRTALQLKPDYENAYYNLGIALRERGRIEEALAAFDKCISLNPGNMPARWAHCMAHLPVVYPDSASIRSCRGRYEDELHQLSGTVTLKSPREINAAASAVGSQQPFYLAYQGLNDRELQGLYGSLVCRIMAARYPQFAGRPAMPSHPDGEPLRVGMVSGFFYHHPVWRIIAKGWAENIDKARIRLYGYYTGGKMDEETGKARLIFSRFVEGGRSFEDLCGAISDDNLHAIIYPEIGMDSVTLRLAALRLAPVQCVSWGHPDTSGLPTIDYFLSGDLLEPSDGDEAYTEQLIRLPNLSVCYTPGEDGAAVPGRETFGLRPGSVLFHCCQTLFKFLPEYDEVFPRIADIAGDCQFLFSSLPESAVDLFRSRLRSAFARYNLDADDHVVFVGRLSEADYKAFNRLCDIFLDPPGWSGCTSSFEAVDACLPLVALPGSLMRQRESGAILAMMGITETVARDLDEYVSIAANLALDTDRRQKVSDKIAQKRHILYRDRTCVAALEDFIETAVKERQVSSLMKCV